MAQHRFSPLVAASFLLAACSGGNASTPAVDASTTADATSPSADASGLQSTDAGEDATPGDSGSTDSHAPDDAPVYLGPTVHISGTAVESPSAAALAGVTVCPFAQPLLPCSTTPANGSFDVQIPASSETGVTLSVAGRESVLVPLETTTANLSGWEIGMTAASDVQAIYTAFGATYPDSTTGFLAAYASPPGEQIGLAGLTMTIVPGSGKGPIYLTAAGAPAPSATETSTYSVGFFGNVAPGDVTLTFAPASTSTTLSCSPSFGGWTSSLGNSVRVPIAAGFDTHVGMACTATTVDGGASSDAGGDGGDAAVDAGGD